MHRVLGGPVKLAAILIGIIITVFFLACSGLAPLFVAFGFGWFAYLGRVIPQLQPDAGTVALAILCFLGVILGAQWFLRWLYRTTSSDGEPRRWPWKWTIQLVGLVMLMFVAGIAATGLAHQIAWLTREPVILKGGIRHLAARTNSMNNLKMMAIASHSVAVSTADAELPRSTFDLTGRPLHAWQTQLLPYMEEERLFESVQRQRPWDDPANAEAMARIVKPFLSTDQDITKVQGRGASHYAGNVEIFLTDRAKRLEDPQSFPRGISNTILIGEAATNHRAWGDPLNVRDPRLGQNQHSEGFGAPNRKPAFAMADGSTRVFDPKELQEYIDLLKESP